MVSPSVEPITTLKRGSAWTCGSASPAGSWGRPARRRTAAPERRRRHPERCGTRPCRAPPARPSSRRLLTMVIDEPLAQLSNLNGPVPIGFSLLVVGAFRRHDHRVAPAHIVEEGALRVLQRHLDGRRVDDLDRVDRREQALLRIGRIVGARAVEREFHVVGVEVAAVVEFHAGVQLERIGLAVVGDRPAFGERRQHFAVRADAGQALEDVGVDHLVDRRGSAGRRVEMRRLQQMPSTRSVRAAKAALLLASASAAAARMVFHVFIEFCSRRWKCGGLKREFRRRVNRVCCRRGTLRRKRIPICWLSRKASLYLYNAAARHTHDLPVDAIACGRSCPWMPQTLKAQQAPLKTAYRETPDKALITLSARKARSTTRRSPARSRPGAPSRSPACIRRPAAPAWSFAPATCCSKRWSPAPA